MSIVRMAFRRDRENWRKKMWNLIETHRLHRRHLFAAGAIAAILAAFQAGALPTARSGQAQSAATSESRVPFGSTSYAEDAVFTDFRDHETLARETDAVRRDGFTAEAAIHPAPLAIINARFTPTEAERLWAERVIAAFKASRLGVVQLDGVMLDAPHLIISVQASVGTNRAK
jgi:citrate lyase beta subunit